MNRTDPDELEAAAAQAMASGEYMAALRLLDRIIGLGNPSASVWLKTGNGLLAVREFAQAIGAFANAVAIDSQLVEAHHNLARAYYTLGELDRATPHLWQTVKLTDQIDPWLALATVLPNAPNASHDQVLGARREFAKRLAEASQVSAVKRPARSKRIASEPIRVAYLSAHFAGRNYMKPVWALVNHHDRRRIHVHLLCDKESPTQFAGYQRHANDTIHDVSKLDDVSLASLLEQLQIDVLVDLSAFSYTSRLSLFTRPLTPVTIAWFNMYATSGLPAFDHIIGDRHVIWPAEEQYYSETVLRLPLSYLTFEVDYPVPDVAPAPCFSRQQFTFGSLVSQYKITEPTCAAWSEMLTRCPMSRLILANTELKSPHNRDYVIQRFVDNGVAREQIVCLPPTDHDKFLRYYDQIDLALDSFPYSGGTTTMEALWQ
ncbi:MAG: hypothetical protein KDB23_14040, partial [Planctomycetales bacterium]|nr:hypothetical protein [Planctomycetales bacterium]